MAAGPSNGFTNIGQGNQIGQGYPRELVDEKFISKDDFHNLEMTVQKLENNLKTSQLENDNKTLKQKLAAVQDLGKWSITTIIAIVALAINILNHH
ncbi:hypothetical protein AB3K25_04260 [Leuconostoc sp. MS02]|uniref:Uncharacterized protein n=1 Tax=Leuconostoc aquikimchii TaxID=3236804 RepID=A0ABV3S5A3_9LACO